MHPRLLFEITCILHSYFHSFFLLENPRKALSTLNGLPQSKNSAASKSPSGPESPDGRWGFLLRFISFWCQRSENRVIGCSSRKDEALVLVYMNWVLMNPLDC